MQFMKEINKNVWVCVETKSDVTHFNVNIFISNCNFN